MTGEKRQEELIDAARERNFAAELRGKGYVVLTAEEAAFVRRHLTVRHSCVNGKVLALLTPSAGREGQVAPVALAPAEDIGPPAPGKGDDLPRPEQGMEC